MSKLSYKELLRRLSENGWKNVSKECLRRKPGETGRYFSEERADNYTKKVLHRHEPSDGSLDEFPPRAWVFAGPVSKRIFFPPLLWQAKGNTENEKDVKIAKRRIHFEILMLSVFSLIVFLFVAAFTGIQSGAHLTGNNTAIYETSAAIDDTYQSTFAYSEDGASSIFRIFANNFIAAACIMLIGFVPYIPASVIYISRNAYIVGLLAGLFTAAGYPSSVLYASLLPHGIFEIPALCIASGMGLTICIELVRTSLRDKRPRLPFKEVLLMSSKYFICICVPLLLVAAFIEVEVTPGIMENIVQALR